MSAAIDRFISLSPFMLAECWCGKQEMCRTEHSAYEWLKGHCVEQHPDEPVPHLPCRLEPFEGQRLVTAPCNREIGHDGLCSWQTDPDQRRAAY